MPALHEETFQNPKKYKGSIWFTKGKTKSGHTFVRKDRPFDKQSYGISEEEYNWLTNRHKAQKLWAYKHFPQHKVHPMRSKEQSK